jgi:hypothetical protein
LREKIDHASKDHPNGDDYYRVWHDDTKAVIRSRDVKSETEPLFKSKSYTDTVIEPNDEQPEPTEVDSKTENDAENEATCDESDEPLH